MLVESIVCNISVVFWGHSVYTALVDVADGDSHDDWKLLLIKKVVAD